MVLADGFTNIIDIALDGTGGGYVLEHDADGLLGPGTAGRLVHVSASGTTSRRDFASALLSDGTSRSPPLRLASPSSPPDLGQRTFTSKLSNMLGTRSGSKAS